MQQISARQLSQRLNDANQARPLLLDVREPWEYETCHIEGSQLMPMRAIAARYTELDAHIETVVICHHGARSLQVVMFLERQGFSNVINLNGGVAAWAHEVDLAMPKY